MKENLERKIFLNDDPESNLYSWALQELDEKGNQIGSDQVPWSWSLVFTANELRYHNLVSIDNKETHSDKEFIIGTLYPGRCENGEELEQVVSYSMFGTSRKINRFDLRIRKLQNDTDSEHYSICGIVRYM